MHYPDGRAIIPDMPNSLYHAGKGLSKSTLWQFHKSRSPAHYRQEQDVPRPRSGQQKAALDMGTAIHTAILEPHLFARSVVRGGADRRGSQWTSLVDANPGKVVLLDKDYDAMARMRDKIHADDFLRPILGHSGNRVEHSAFWTDPETGSLCKCRPDLVHPAGGLIIDIKTTGDARPREFGKLMGDLGYHAQEAWYREGWARAGGPPVEGWVFLVVERDPPFEFRVYELPPCAVEEGHQAIHEAKRRYATCLTDNHWPGYERRVEEIDLKPWHYHYVSREVA